MTRQILGRDLRVGKRWPYRFLNMLPTQALWRYLVWQSGGNVQEPPFQLGQTLKACKHILIVMPDDMREFLIALPIVQAHFRGLPGATTWLLASPREIPFLSAIFGPERLLTLDPEQFYLGEAHFGETLRRLQAMRIDLVLNFHLNPPPLLLYLVRASLAPLRVQFAVEPRLPFANITLKPAEPLNLLRNYLMATHLWGLAERPVSSQWSRLYAPAEGLSKAEALLSYKNLNGDNTVLFVWQNRPEAVQTELLRAVSSKLIQDGGKKSAAVVYGGDPGFESEAPPAQILADFPCLKAESTSVLLGLFTQVSRVLGMNGPLLHLASLSVAEVEGFFEAVDSPFDTSFLNKRLRVFYVDKKKAKDEGAEKEKPKAKDEGEDAADDEKPET